MLPSDNFPIYLTTGEKLNTPEALQKYRATNEARSKGKGYQAAIAKEHLNHLQTIIKQLYEQF
jgi:hypothetical protein